MQEPRRDHHDRAPLDRVAVRPVTGDGGPADRPGRRPEPDRLRDDGLRVREVRQIADRRDAVREDGVELGVQAPLRVRAAREQPPGPRERDRGGLVTGEEQREGLVPNLLVGHAGPVLTRTQQQREKIVPARSGRAPFGDHLRDHAVQVGLDAAVPAHRWRGQPHEQAEQRRVHAVEHPERVREGPPDRRALPLVDVRSEQGVAHHCEGERRHLGLDVDLLAVAPALGGSLGEPDHRLRVGRDPFVVEHGLDQAPPAEVGLVLTREQRLAEQHLRRLDRGSLVERTMTRDQDVADEVGMVQQVRGRTRHVDRDHVAVRGKAFEESQRIAPERPERGEPRQVRTRRSHGRRHGPIIDDPQATATAWDAYEKRVV